jgi:hypothetical protein
LQILGVTCDNATNNEVMIDELANLTPDFWGASSRARCFLHVVNLVAKSIIWIFDIKKKDVDAALASSDVVVEWNELAALSRESEDSDERLDEDNERDNEGGWMDKMELLGREDREELLEELVLLKLALTKVCSHGTTYLLANSTYRYANWAPKLLIPPPCCFLHGSRSCKTCSRTSPIYCGMLRPDGIWPMICLSMPWCTGKL